MPCVVVVVVGSGWDMGAVCGGLIVGSGWDMGAVCGGSDQKLAFACCLYLLYTSVKQSMPGL